MKANVRAEFIHKPLKPTGFYTYTFNVHKLYVLPTQCAYVFCMDLRTNSDFSLYSIN